MTADEKVNILMVDDEPAKLLSYKVILEELGENLIEASSARQALGILLKTDVAVVLMDVSMPEMDGFEATAAIREREKVSGSPHQVVIAMTAHAIAGDRERCLKAGMDGYVSKPFRIAELLKEIEALTGITAST